MAPRPNFSPALIRSVADYAERLGFTGKVGINSQAINSRSIRRMLRNMPDYTFGITAIEQAVGRRELKASKVREILETASGLKVPRFNTAAAGSFEPTQSAAELLTAVRQIAKSAQAREKIIFATGHPGSLLGFMQILSAWAKELGGEIWQLSAGFQAVRHRKLFIDAVGDVIVTSDSASAWHTHRPIFMDVILASVQPDLVVADHGFTGAALNANIPSIGIYDTNDPALPVAQYLGLPLTAVPLNDNRLNLRGTELAKFVIQKMADENAI